MKPRRNIRAHLELGVGTGERLVQIAKQRRHDRIIGVDKKKPRRPIAIRGTKLVFGKRGDAKRFLLQAIQKGDKFDEVNAEYFFGNLVPQVNESSALFHGWGFEMIFAQQQSDHARLKVKTGEVLRLIKQVLKPNGVLRIEARKDSLRDFRAWLRTNGFASRAKKLSAKEIASRWGKIYYKQAVEGESSRQPYEILAWVG